MGIVEGWRYLGMRKRFVKLVRLMTRKWITFLPGVSTAVGGIQMKRNIGIEVYDSIYQTTKTMHI